MISIESCPISSGRHKTNHFEWVKTEKVHIKCALPDLPGTIRYLSEDISAYVALVGGGTWYQVLPYSTQYKLETALNHYFATFDRLVRLNIDIPPS
jgi:hypothetical protein